MSGDPSKLVADADKALSGSTGSDTGSGLIVGITKSIKKAFSAPNYDLALDKLKEAAAAQNARGKPDEAGLLWERIASIQKDDMKDDIEPYHSWQEAAKFWRKTEKPERAAELLDRVVTHYVNSGQTRRAASLADQIATLYEKEVATGSKSDEAKLAAPEHCLLWLKKSAGWYDMESNAGSTANKVWLRYADLLAQQGDYYGAIEVYEKQAKWAVDNNLMRYSVKEYLFKAGLCQLATGDIVGMRRALQNYVAIDRTFERETEYKFLSRLTEAVEQGDADQFVQECDDFDKTKPLDTWKTSLLVMVKNGIEKQDDDFS